MNILMMTNTYTPHVGGVSRSVQFFTEEYRKRGHRTIVVAPVFENMPEDEEDVIRIPAIQNFNGSDFSLMLPVPGYLNTQLENFHPTVVHAHHPFLMGALAIRVSTLFDIPLVFTHHTMWERYTHYVPGDSEAMKRFAMELATGYANLCNQVIAPSESIGRILAERGVAAPIEAVPTGVYVDEYANGDGAAFRANHNLPAEAFVIGHVGRLAPEKNLEFLAEAVAQYVKRDPRAHFLVVGSGISEKAIEAAFALESVRDRLLLAGRRSGQELVDAYHAMDVFAFASHTETQGMVLTEAMAAGVGVVALDAAGAREVVKDQVNGRLLMEEDREAFAAALEWMAERTPQERDDLRAAALQTANDFSMARCTERMLDIYGQLSEERARKHSLEESVWQRTVEQMKAEWDLITNVAGAVASAIRVGGSGKDEGR